MVALIEIMLKKQTKYIKKVLKRDIEKHNILKENGIEVLYYTNITDLPDDIFINKKYKKIYNENNFFTNLDLLIQKIRKK